MVRDRQRAFYLLRNFARIGYNGDEANREAKFNFNWMTKKIWAEFRSSLIGETVRSLVPDSLVNLLFHFPLAFLAVLFYRYPARHLKVIGVTGTDGKTTTANLIHHLFLRAGKKAALVSTIAAKIGRQEIPTGFHVTSPHPWKLQRLLREIADKGYQLVVLEATSHGLDQHRLFGSNFNVGVMTNVTHEHLDYHQTYQRYLEAKAKLFRGVKIAVLNRDDQSYQFLVTKLQRSKGAKIITYGLKHQADFTPQRFKFKTFLPGEYNQYNCLAAIATVSSLGVAAEKIRQGMISFKGLTGRMEAIDEGQDFKVYVDFAHTPNALKNVLATLKEKKKGRLLVVFGSAGERDKEKRPKMGETATQLADIVILTAEDPRTEEVDAIIDQISQGCQKAGGVEGKTFYRRPDRTKAIQFAIKKAAKDDLIVICGKGHEKTMCFGRTEYPWSDQEAVRKALKKRK
jgi:UDP-N-acetylmuramoyl-L-alanyl-D-glutamate--2,6-diaminopimelate ligase